VVSADNLFNLHPVDAGVRKSDSPIGDLVAGRSGDSYFHCLSCRGVTEALTVIDSGLIERIPRETQDP
jgi:hypothetical protein